jgi:hypothetical protein
VGSDLPYLIPDLTKNLIYCREIPAFAGRREKRAGMEGDPAGMKVS